MKTRIESKKKVMMKCPICRGTGIQEETTKSFRRYKCWCCEGKRIVPHPFQNEEEKDGQTENS